MRKISVLMILLLLNGSVLFSQVGINTDGSAPNSAAMLDVKSTTKGLLPPRMSHAEMNAIASPAFGLIVYCTDCGATGLGTLCLCVAGTWYMLDASCMTPLSPVTGAHVPAATQIAWNWNTVSGATGYKWGTTNVYASATDMGTAVTKTETGLTCNTAYTRYAWAYSACGNSTPVTLTQITSLSPPAVPTSGTHVPAATQVIWNWNTVSGATGYKWGTTNVYASATDMGTAVTKTETGLTCNTAYTRYAWAYSACGNSTPVTLIQTTSLSPPAQPARSTHIRNPCTGSNPGRLELEYCIWCHRLQMGHDQCLCFRHRHGNNCDQNRNRADLQYRLHPLCMGLQRLRELHAGYPDTNNFAQPARSANFRHSCACCNSNRLELEHRIRCHRLQMGHDQCLCFRHRYGNSGDENRNRADLQYRLHPLCMGLQRLWELHAANADTINRSLCG
ncbi:MAG: hypothetical protein NT040_18205 [Bacteroidetes bacterium]|nr:hypothetical protein [Bacteroidota bacterium]